MKRKTYYIAYGSNLSVEQMAVRCPDAKIVGMATLKDWKLVFRFHADIVPCEGRVVPVLIWEISERDERNLDGKNPHQVNAMVYVMVEGHSARLPMKGYYDVIAEGYKRFGFNNYILEQALKEAKEAQEHELS